MKNIKEWLLYKILREFKKCAGWIIVVVCGMITNIAALIRDKQLGIETSESCRFKDYSLNKDMYNYAATAYRTAQKTIDYLDLGPDDVFIDLGCGKGRAVFVAAFKKLKKAIGVELDKDIIEVAQKNLRTVKVPHAPIDFVCADATNFDVSEGTVFYLYNPFGYKTTASVLENIRVSLEAKPRRIRIVLCCPFHRDIFDRQKWLELEKEMDKGDTVIWRNI